MTNLLGSLKIVPVEADDENAPGPGHAKVNYVRGIAYVLVSDWPAIKDELENLTTQQ